MGLFVVTQPPRRSRLPETTGRRAYRKPTAGRQWLILVPLAAAAAYFQYQWAEKRDMRPKQITSATMIAPTREVPCPHCAGDDGRPKGVVRHPDSPELWIDCPVCFGTGRRLIKMPNPSNQELCPRCSGMGRYVEESKVIPCERCEEWGFVDTTVINRTVMIPDEPVQAEATPEALEPMPRIELKP